MSKLTITGIHHSSAKLKDDMARFARRIEATPPGMCPVAFHLSLLKSSEVQTCGKCVPCRDGIPQMTAMLEKIVKCEATPETLENLKALATIVRDSADCAIGYEAANIVLSGMETFAAEYASHVNEKLCTEDVEQKVPCEAMCPAHVNVPAYIALAGEGDYAGAINMIRRDNPFPTACALICEHPCEDRCRRTLIDAPINIRGIKKFAVDQLHADKVQTPPRNVDTGKKIAVVGGGPSGLTAAYFLALMGHKVVVFEDKKELGGMLRYGIPAYRFPRERLDEDIRAILGVGNIEVKYETYVDAEAMKKIAEEYDAVYVAIGAHTGKTLRLANTDAKGVSSAVDMLREIGYNRYPDFHGKKVAVVGGGNVAMDCARTSVRAGADEVTVIYRRRQEDMTALPSEVESAIAEGVEMLTLQAPGDIVVDDNGNCKGIKVQPQMIGPVKGGRPAPVTADKPEGFVEADVILIAVGQDIVCQPFEEFGMKTDRGRFVANEYLEADGYKNIFVGGDCQTGPATVIKAIGAGRVAARNIDEFLGYHHKLDCGVEVPEPKQNDRTPKGRVNITEREARIRKNDFLGVENEMSREEAVQECGRCLRCDHYGCGALEGGRLNYD
ncbi:NAD(P)-binding protein [Eubacterium oxidoreducens]|uniref:NADPH-dependent glutamate synthase beta chain n=1 Tax=Eubacterium oxidoreducens TaxID=1732 RepID=A0A1G6CB08_EUBOX|nr:NAD(P)-binding protein [Eubacterium oxidoreducens]SDB30014.1 NADPH-dependent glutamate synthase beta chain [Eubacterium oxidoreducens]